MHNAIEKPRPFRLQMKFWLDANKPLERELGLYLDDLRLQRKFTPTIRNAVRLYKSLQEGRADVLFELFPNIQDVISRYQIERLFSNNSDAG